MKKYIALFLCIVMCASTVIVPAAADTTARDVTVEESYASVLKSLGLFRGVSETNFDLKRAPTRVEALIMLIRVLGEEKTALEGDWEHPFTDVAKWADPYVGYAYETGLTKGVSATEFGNSDSTAAMYLTFMLRALGYSDVNNEDFSWNDPYSLARTAGILTDAVNIEVFWRADAVTVSFEALPAYLKNSEQTLAAKLIEAGVFTKEQYDAAMNSVGTTPGQSTGTPLTAMQISEKCAPAVFYIEVYGYNGKVTGSGSGFFISGDGYAITNYHVAANSLYMVITTASGEKYEDVAIVDASRENDLALLKVNSDDTFTYLEFGESDAIKQGQNVYAIGSPRGLDNTLSQGIISNTSRTIDGTHYMQISVPIDHGSSGGALIDQYGKVIAVTTAGITDNTADLNLAVPISYVKMLDITKTKDIEIFSDDFYPGFEGAYNFGIFTGIDMVDAEYPPLGYYITYNAADITRNGKYADIPLGTYCLDIYGTALIKNGFTVTQINEDTTFYESETEEVTVTLDLDLMHIYVLAEWKPQYYAEQALVPDAGWYFEIADVEYIVISESMHMYRYKWSDYYSKNNFEMLFDDYVILLADYGFEFSSKITVDHNTSCLGRGEEYNIICNYNDTAFTVTIYRPTVQNLPQSTPQTSAYYRLKEYLISYGEYDIEFGNYEMKIWVGDALYDISYDPESKNICLGSGVFGASTDVHSFVFLYENGYNQIALTYKTTYLNVVYDAKIVLSEFSSEVTLTPYKYTGSATYEKFYHDLAITRAIASLKNCEKYFLKEIGITLADLGFTAIN